VDYHRPSDTVEKIDGEGLLKVASVAKEIVEYLAGREGPLTSTLGSTGKTEGGPEHGRTVSLGTIPDFAFDGEGYRLSGVVPGSPADRSGLREGDVIVGIGSQAIHDLKSLSRVLKSLTPGERISLTFLRRGERRTVEAEVLKR
jgi:aminopeptidase N